MTKRNLVKITKVLVYDVVTIFKIECRIWWKHVPPKFW